MPSVSAADVQPPPQEQARAETILAPGAGTVEVRVAEHVVRGGDAGDVRTVLVLDDADVDEVGDARQAGRRHVDVLAVLDDERHLVAHGGGRVVGAEVPDLELLRVRPHRAAVVGEVAVLVDVDPDVVGHGVVEDAEQVGGVTVTVDVAARRADRR